MNVVYFYYTNLKIVSVGAMLHQFTQLLPALFYWVVLRHTFNVNITHLNKKMQTQEFKDIICFQDADTSGKKTENERSVHKDGLFFHQCESSGSMCTTSSSAAVLVTTQTFS